MAQILKERIRNSILSSAVNEFYHHDYKGATMKKIADGAGIPAGLIYSYFKNKEELFSEVVAPVGRMMKALNNAELTDDPEKNLYEHELPIWLKCIEKNNREMVILIDKSGGSRFESLKDEIIEDVTEHLKITPVLKATSFDPIFYHILATNFMEGIFEIARHYKNREWAEEMLRLLIRQHRWGADSLNS